MAGLRSLNCTGSEAQCPSAAASSTMRCPVTPCSKAIRGASPPSATCGVSRNDSICHPSVVAIHFLPQIYMTATSMQSRANFVNNGHDSVDSVPAWGGRREVAVPRRLSGKWGEAEPLICQKTSIRCTAYERSASSFPLSLDSNLPLLPHGPGTHHQPFFADHASAVAQCNQRERCTLVNHQHLGHRVDTTVGLQ